MNRNESPRTSAPSVRTVDTQVTRHRNPGGPTVSTATGRVVQVDGLWFRDPESTGTVQPYADWRLEPEERAKDLAQRLTLEQMAGLMLYSPHQMVPALPNPHFRATYDGRDWDAEQLDPATLTDQQQDLLLRDHIRHVLVMTYSDVDTAVRWHNAMQATAEEQLLSIPINFSTDPRHGSGEGWGAEFRGDGVQVSKWPEGLGMAATYDLERVRRFADVVRQEYRALGFATALGPQVDLATEPRWMRAIDTFGGDVERVVQMVRTFIDALQTTPGAAGGWGAKSVIGMAKHWPGGGTGEGGRDAHYWFGKYNVYPGDNFDTHLRPFTEGAFQLDGPTRQAGAIMPYYSVSVGHTGQDAAESATDAGVGNSYSEYLLKDLLRGEYGYDGVVCTDWGLVTDLHVGPYLLQARCFGVEDLTEAERHLRIIMNGADQFGGNSDVAPVLEAYRLGAERYGEDVIRSRFQESAVRLLRGMFRVGLFDDPYLDPEESAAIVGNADFVRDGFQAQLASVVPLKVGTTIPRGSKVWVPQRHIDKHKAFFRFELPAVDTDGLRPELVGDYYTLVDSPDQADAAIVIMSSPMCDPYDQGEYHPISLQFRPYDAPTAREHSLAGDRSYRGNASIVANVADLDNLEAARAALGDKPVVAVIQLDTPVVMSEIEPVADSVYAHFGVSQKAILDIVSGEAEAGGRLPYRLPKDMAGIEAHCEDVFGDFDAYVDAAGRAYDVGFSATRE